MHALSPNLPPRRKDYGKWKWGQRWISQNQTTLKEDRGFIGWLSALLDNNLRNVCYLNFGLPVVKRDLSRYSHGFALVLLRIREVPGASGWNKGGDDLIRVLAAQVQENVASPGLVNAVHFVCYGCDFADMLGRFGSRVNCRGLCNGCGGEGADEQSKEYFGFHGLRV